MTPDEKLARSVLEYVVQATYTGVPDERDKRLGKAVGRPSDGSGYAFGSKKRDNHWYYKRASAADAALKRIRAAKIRGVKARIFTQE